MTDIERDVETPHGPGRLVLSPTTAQEPIATLVISHGAGNGIDSRDLLALADALPRHGVTVARLEQPWKVAGRKIATPPASLDAGLRAGVAALRLQLGATPLVVGGRSAGARSAARCAAELGAAGCLALAFPLHPPGRPERSRLAELQGAGVPTLVIQGERDPMGRPEEFPEEVPLSVVPGGDHGLRVPARGPLSEADAMAVVVEATLEWLIREVLGIDVGGNGRQH